MNRSVLLLSAAFIFCLLCAFPLIEKISRIQFKEELSTRFDPEIGWVSRPNFKNENFYGPGKKLSTNRQGFRGGKNYSAQTPQGKVRIICSGDSYTLGYGVADHETWCAQLETLMPGTETINMGQGGYGIDQSYLWYSRQGLPLEHHVHLFAFISDDFYRMRRDHLMGIYPKPLLEVKQGLPEPINTPLQKPFFPRTRIAAEKILQKLRVIPQAQISALFPQEVVPLEKNAGLFSLFFSIAAELQKMADSKRAKLVLIYLPDPGDLFEETNLKFRHQLSQYCVKKGLTFLDLTPAFKSASPQETESYFDRQTGHYSVKGNVRAAQAVRDFLMLHFNSPPTEH